MTCLQWACKSAPTTPASGSCDLRQPMVSKFQRCARTARSRSRKLAREKRQLSPKEGATIAVQAVPALGGGLRDRDRRRDRAATGDSARTGKGTGLGERGAVRSRSLRNQPAIKGSSSSAPKSLLEAEAAVGEIGASTVAAAPVELAGDKPPASWPRGGQTTGFLAGEALGDNGTLTSSSFLARRVSHVSPWLADMPTSSTLIASASTYPVCE